MWHTSWALLKSSLLLSVFSIYLDLLSKVIITLSHRLKQTNIVALAMCQRIKIANIPCFKNEAKWAICASGAFQCDVTDITIRPGLCWRGCWSSSLISEHVTIARLKPFLVENFGNVFYVRWKILLHDVRFNSREVRLNQTSYRSGTVNSKPFIGKVFLKIKWKFELIYAL